MQGLYIILRGAERRVGWFHRTTPRDGNGRDNYLDSGGYMLPSAAWDLPAQFPWCPVLPLELDGILDPLHREDFPPFLNFFDERITYFERKGNVQLDTAFFFFLIVTNQKGKLHWVRGRIEFRRESEEKIRRTKT